MYVASGFDPEKDTLIVLGPDNSHYIVYLKGRDYEIDWQTTTAFDICLEAELGRRPPTKMTYAQLLNRAAVLDNAPDEHLTRRQLYNFKYLLAEGISRVFSEADLGAASAMLDEAERFVTARYREKARVWYLAGSGAAFALAACATLVLWLARSSAQDVFGATLFRVLLGAGCGAAGAVLSILLRVGSTPLDPSSGRKLHLIEGSVRVAAGMLGAAVLALGVRLGLVGPVVVGDPERIVLLALTCVAAGASERLVPSFLEGIEKQATRARDGTPDPSAAPAEN
ncbi:MAG TPA: hypothetical protein VH092_26490 [Urbifossiella sp.]|jgi:hypothetical protein|nr:hypothetical protein [Urbifossiella sp.]